MTIIVTDEYGRPMKAHLFFYDAAGGLLGEEVIPIGGVEITPVADAVSFKFVADGYKDAVIDDLYDYGNTTMEMIPRFKWVVPAVIGAAAVFLISKYVKF